ncbi:hypothetical protein V6N11_015776 [Hibiscus sabdariffa]|uniref:Uncharacterized protein n=1 Tax=Hibiscus sabdariffa TaxID=183260 RepID=A0ABR2TT47_9ROSI
MKGSDVKTNVITFGILIDQLCKLHSVDEAMELFNKIGKESRSPEEGLKLMERMKSGTDTGYNIVFDLGGKSIIDGGNNSVALGRDGVVSNAGISDTIEEEWFAMNRFEGHIPLGWNDATQVYLQINSFPGSVPNNIGELMRQLHTLFLFYNRIRGKLPALICKMKRMEFLFVGQNIIIAQLPDCWNDLRSLKVIDASNISLSGGILNPLISSYLLIVLMLGDNGLCRNISFSLCGCRQVSWIYVLQLRSNLNEGINIFTQSKTWYQFQAVLRVSLEIFLFFGIRALIMIGVRDQNDRRDSWHHGGWTTKIVVWILLVLLVFFLLSLVITVSETLSEFCATLHFRGNDSLLHAVVISIYCAFVCYMSLASEPRDYVCSGLQYKSSIVSKGTLIIETLKRILSVIYSELRVGSLTPFLALSPSSRAGSIPLILSSMTLLNHVMLSYNNWSRRIPTRNQPQMLNDSSNYEDSSPPTLFFQDVDPKDKL